MTLFEKHVGTSQNKHQIFLVKGPMFWIADKYDFGCWTIVTRRMIPAI